MPLLSSLQPLALVLSLLMFSAPAFAGRDYKGDPGVVKGLFEESRVAQTAASIGRGSGLLTAEEVATIAKAINKKKAIPAVIDRTWQKCLRMAQSANYLQNTKHFYPVGYEWESTHTNKISWEEWDKGSKEFQNMIAGSFGVQKSVVFDPKSDKLYPSARIYDEGGRKWSLTTEHVDMDILKSGYELGTPPIFKPMELEQISAFRGLLGTNRMGQSNAMTGAHQTYFPFPTDVEKVDTKLAGRVAANLQILQANYGVAIHDMMAIRRMGGAESNLFFRPLIYDHYELLQDFANADPATFDLDAVKTLLFDKYIEKEFEIQLAALVREDIYNEEDAAAARKWTKAEKAKFKTAWKYRDTQLKIGNAGQPVLLWESRIGDYIADEPEQAMMKTLLDELVIDQAYTLAREGKIAKLTVSPRAAGETEENYWHRLQLDPAMTPEAFVQDIGLKNNEVKRMLLGKSFVASDFHLAIADKLTFAFEMEGWDKNLVNLVLPRDPKLRADWRKMSGDQRVRAMKKIGFDIEGGYNPDQYRILTTEFYGDYQKYDFLHSEVKLEASGNWEIKSYGRTLRSEAELRTAVNTIGKNLNAFGLHLHAFFPDPLIQAITGANSEAYGKFLELQSLAMSLQGYAEADPKDAGHWLDSWSLDRYSPADIEQVKKHLTGEARLNGVDQKYHNMAFRPVEGGLDIEPRDLDDDVDHGMAQLRYQIEFISDPKMPEAIKDSKPIFSEFREHANGSPDLAQYTLEDAVGKKYPLTASQKKLLHQFQFEIYKPSMENFLYFKDFSAIDETPNELLDAAYVRTNYENNVALPLLNYHEQSFLTADQLKVLDHQRDVFIDSVYKKLLAVETDPKYTFMKKSDNFLDLCGYLERSKHASRPKFGRLPEATKEIRRIALEDLVYELRGEVVTYVKATKLNQMITDTVQSLSCPVALKKSRKSAVAERAINGASVTHPKEE
jgi:hypothetical protein